MLTENLQKVEQNIREACKKVNRAREEITLIAVSKTKPVSMLDEVYRLGIRDFGENKVQELLEKYEKLPKDIRWHMIGHLQTNKVKYIIDKVYLIHSVDSLHLAQEISKQATKHNLTVKILIEVNIAREESKFGVLEEDTIDCPYCNAEVPINYDEDVAEIECPECHNTIELDWSGDLEDGGCSGHCSSCGGCHNDEEE